MYQNGQQFYGGDGLVKKGVENTIQSISRLGRIGMKETDKEIISMMIEKQRNSSLCEGAFCREIKEAPATCDGRSFFHR